METMTRQDLGSFAADFLETLDNDEMEDNEVNEREYLAAIVIVAYKNLEGRTGVLSKTSLVDPSTNIKLLQNAVEMEHRSGVVLVERAVRAEYEEEA